MKDLDTFIDEVSAVLDKKSLLKIYNIATSELFSLWYVKSTAKDKNDMFYQNFNKIFQILIVVLQLRDKIEFFSHVNTFYNIQFIDWFSIWATLFSY